MLKRILPVLLPFILTNCTSLTDSSTSSQLNVRATLPFSVQDVAYAGIGIVPEAKVYKIKATLPKDSAKLFFRTRHREEIIDKPAQNFEYFYIPQIGLEDSGSRLTTISVITQKGNLLQAFFDFIGDEKLPATLLCNGKRTYPIGVSFCQSRELLISRIEFARFDVLGMGGKDCPSLIQDGRFFTFEMKKGICTYAFRTKDGLTHRLVSRGFDSLEGE